MFVNPHTFLQEVFLSPCLLAVLPPPLGLIPATAYNYFDAIRGWHPFFGPPLSDCYFVRFFQAG